jgi:RHS repeat-associated protein
VTTNPGTRSFTHDARGNLSAESRPNGTATPTSVTTAYDGYGRLKTYSRSAGITNQNMVYNGMDDRVAQATTGGTVQARYVYDSQGRMLGDYLAGATAAGTRGEYIYINPDAANDNASPYGGDDGMGGYGLLAVATKDAANAPVIHYIHSNHLGVPILTLNSAGAVIAAGTYTQPVFPGQMKTYADLYYNRYRDYDPTTGRYIQADPIGLEGGDNPYLYAEGNPVRYVDPKGLFIDTIADIGFVLYDLYRIGKDNIFGDGCEGDSLGGNLMALGLDAGAIFVPFVTGAGPASRAARNADDLAEQAADLVSLNGGRNRVTIRSPSQQMEVDLAGKAHGGVPTPHTKVSPLNPQAPNQPAFNTRNSPVTPATPQDIRTVRRYLERQN